MSTWPPILVLTFAFLCPSLSFGQETAPAPEPRLQQALEKLASNDFEGAIAVLESLKESGEASDQALATLGALYVEIGLLADALDVLGPLAAREDANPAVLFNAGRAAVELGEDERGEEYLRRSVNAQPVSPAARLLGIRLGARGQLVASYQLLRPWALANPGDVEVRLAAAVTALRLERVPEAGELLEGLPDENPRVRLLRADHALQSREPASALELLEPLADSHPPEMTVDVSVLLATAYLELGRSADAVSLLRERGGQHPKLALTLAQALYQGGDVEGALGALTPFAEPLVSAESPEQVPPAMRQLGASVVLEQGRLLLAAERLPDAVKALERASELRPWSDETWQELARAHAMAGDTEKAEQATARLREIAAARERSKVPGMAGQKRLADPTGRRLAEALEWLERGESEQALATVRQEIALAGDDIRPRLLEVRILLLLERRQEALASIGSTLEQFPDHPDALHFRAVALMSQGNAEAAEKDLRRALELAAGHVPALNDLALVLAGRGERAEARRLLEKVLELAPGDPLATRRLAALDAEVSP